MTNARPARSARPGRTVLVVAVLALAVPAAAPVLDSVHDGDRASSLAGASAPVGPQGQDWGWE
jgi:hypothetical protein